MENKFLDEPDATHDNESSSPIYGYQDQQITTLEEAVQSITHVIPNVINYVTQAKLQCRKTNILTEDESAAIYLYTMDSPFFRTLNHHLRTMNKQALRPWFAYLKLFIATLNKLPSFKGTVWRGVSTRINFTPADYAVYALQTWWAITSTSKELKIIEHFLGETGTLYSIETINGKDVSQYSAIPNEQEVILMPGTRIYLTNEPFQVNNGPLMLSFKECTSIPQGKHVMFSHDTSGETIVSQICKLLRDQSITVWFDKEKGRSDNIYDSLGVGVENAAFVCCFISPEYERSTRCQIELQYANKRHKKIIPCLIRAEENWEPVNWLKAIVEGVEYVDFRNLSNTSTQSATNPLFCKLQNLEYVPEDNLERPTILFELIKYEYIRNSRIERFMNPSISYSIEESYINLAIVEKKEQQEKEKRLRNTQNIDEAMGTFEQIYGTKTPIDVKDIFKTCKDQTRKVLVFGRAGIGKSTFCRYVAHQWAKGAIWSEYELVMLIPLRSLTEQSYQAGNDYYLIDILKKQYFFNLRLSVEEEKLLEKQIRASRILWLLDGYDEIAQNESAHIKRLVEQLLNTSNHIVTSRPYMNTLSYSVQMEITGFTDENISNYVKQFFHQMGNESENSSTEYDRLLSYLKLNPRIWGIAHIPINLELICSAWSNTNWSKTKTMTITLLYDKLTEWICRRYLMKQKEIQNKKKRLLDTEGVYQYCQKELEFLQTLAFRAMESSAILLGPDLLKKVKNETKCSFIDFPHLLNIGILKSSTQDGIGNQIESEKDHHFIHLSFQEYFAARHLISALKGSSIEKAVKFIQYQKYNQRYALVFTFASGLLGESDVKPCSTIFWDNILREPLDLVGVRHMKLIISCIEETIDKSVVPQCIELLEWIAKCIGYILSIEETIISKHLSESLQRAQSVTSDQAIINVFINILQYNDTDVRVRVLLFISQLKISNPSIILITSVTTRLDDKNEKVRENACFAIGNIGEKAATNEVISKLVAALEDENDRVRQSACYALGNIGENAATNEVISKLVTVLGDVSGNVRRNARDALGKMGAKTATNEVISKLVTALGDKSRDARQYACETLGIIGEKAATNEVISKLVSALGDKTDYVRWKACKALGIIGEKAATNEVISKLLTALGNESEDVRSSACEALGKIGEKAATNEVISKLLSALGDKTGYVRWKACEALGIIGEKAATNEVISKLLTALGNESEDVRSSACEALGKIGEKAATDEVISKLVTALGDESDYIRENACDALGKIGEKAATNDVISKLVTALEDERYYVRVRACDALGKIGEKAATNEVISKLVTALGDESDYVRRNACDALGKIGEKAATNEVISKLVTVAGDESDYVRGNACDALGKIGEKAATNEVISSLTVLLDNMRCKSLCTNVKLS